MFEWVRTKRTLTSICAAAREVQCAVDTALSPALNVTTTPDASNRLGPWIHPLSKIKPFNCAPVLSRASFSVLPIARDLAAPKYGVAGDTNAGTRWLANA
jgi:hypothetical protein